MSCARRRRSDGGVKLIQDIGDYHCHNIGRRSARCPNSTRGAGSTCRSMPPTHFVLSDGGFAKCYYFMVGLRELYLMTVPGSA